MPTRKSFRQTYRLFPIIVGSFIIFALICGLFILVWSAIAFLSKTDIAAAEGIPVFIWLVSLFLAAGIMTLFTRGGTVFPALFLALITVIISCFLTSEGVLSFGGVMVKLGYSLLFSILGFSFAKLFLILRRSRIIKSLRRKAYMKDPSLFFEETERCGEMDLQLPDNSDFNEYKN